MFTAAPFPPHPASALPPAGSQTSTSHPTPPSLQKTVFRQAGPWCQKGWGPALQGTCLVPDWLLIRLYHLASEIQSENLQEEAEEWQLHKAQLPVLLLRCRQQRPLAVRLGEPTLSSLPGRGGGGGQQGEERPHSSDRQWALPCAGRDQTAVDTWCWPSFPLRDPLYRQEAPMSSHLQCADRQACGFRVAQAAPGPPPGHLTTTSAVCLGLPVWGFIQMQLPRVHCLYPV